jgi:hypothetical protein
MDKKLLQQTTSSLPPDITDALEVFLYTNLSSIISPTPSVLLTPLFQVGLLATLNDVGVRHNISLAKDLKDVLDVFVVENARILSVSTTQEAQPVSPS